MKPTRLMLSCEHAVDTIPPAYERLFLQQKTVLATHRAIDFGAANIAEHLRQHFGCDYVSAEVSRLLIDCNRSLNNRACFSEFTKTLTMVEKQELIAHYYQPYRDAVETKIKTLIQRGAQVLHISCHSFTPVFNDVKRNTDIGLLYDPHHHGEKEVARLWHKLLHQQDNYLTRLNYPYRGVSDGFTSYLRKHYAEKDYLGFELEINQALLKEPKNIQKMAELIKDSLSDLLQIL